MITPTSACRLVLVLGLALATTACSSTPDGSADLHACDLPVDCSMNVGHLGESVTPAAVACESDAVLAGEHAVLASTSTPGPYPTELENLTVLLGDGTALWQVRSRCMVEGGCEEQNTTAWKLGDLERCDVVAIDQPSSSCGFEEGERCVIASLESCVVVAAEDFACEEASAP